MVPSENGGFVGAQASVIAAHEIVDEASGQVVKIPELTWVPVYLLGYTKAIRPTGSALRACSAQIARDLFDPIEATDDPERAPPRQPRQFEVRIARDHDGNLSAVHETRPAILTPSLGGLFPRDRHRFTPTHSAIR